eukprot:UN20748
MIIYLKTFQKHFLDEIQGMMDSNKLSKEYIVSGVVLANLPGDIKNFKIQFLEDEIPQIKIRTHVKMHWKIVFGGKERSALMIALFGSNTENGNLLSARNLDWNR